MMYSDEYVRDLRLELKDTKRALKAVLLASGDAVEVSDELTVKADSFELMTERVPQKQAHLVWVRRK